MTEQFLNSLLMENFKMNKIWYLLSNVQDNLILDLIELIMMNCGRVK